MSTKSGISISLEGIGHVLSDNMLAVPVFQRPYAWDKEQVSQLLNDLDASVKNGGERAEYFLGSIVLAYQDRERAEVVDGQQRLATASILLAAIRDYFAATDDKSTAELIQSRYLLTRHIRTLSMIPRLQLNERDHEFFTRRILSRELDSAPRGSPDSHERISVAAELARAHVERIVARKNTNPRELLIDWVSFLEKRAQVIVVQVPDHADAFTIFETLNDRGADMDVTDLLKNHLLRLAGRDRFTEVDGGWTKVLTSLESAGPRAITDFVRHLWSSRHGLTRERHLYAQIRDIVTTRSTALTFASDLSLASPLYAAILDPENGLWDEIGVHSRDYLAALNRIGVVAMRPLLLAILEQFPAPEVERALRLFVSWATRLFVVGSLGSGALEETYSDLAVRIRAGAIKNSQDLLAIKVCPTDTEFEQAFTAHIPRKMRLAKYYLSVLEMAARGQAYATAGDLKGIQPVILTYILPWDDNETGTAIGSGNIGRLLGNTILLESELSAKTTGLDFAGKREIYSKSQLKLTREVSRYTAWDLAAMRVRQEQLAKLAPTAWTISTKG